MLPRVSDTDAIPVASVIVVVAESVPPAVSKTAHETATPGAGAPWRWTRTRSGLLSAASTVSVCPSPLFVGAFWIDTGIGNCAAAGDHAGRCALQKPSGQSPSRVIPEPSLFMTYRGPPFS